MDFQTFHQEFPFVCNPSIIDKNEGNETDAVPSCDIIFDGMNEIHDGIIATSSVSSKR
jgi:hypothetical protein